MKNMERFIKFICSNRGTSGLVIVCTTFFIIFFSAILSDVAYIALERYKMARCTEEAVLAGAERLAESTDAAKNIIKEYALRQMDDLTGMEIAIQEDARAITVKMEKTLDYIFLLLFGLQEKRIKTDVTVKIAGVKSIAGIRPVAVERTSVNLGGECVLINQPGKKREEMAGFVPLELGKNMLDANILFGYLKEIHTGHGVYAIVGEYAETLAKALNELAAGCSHHPECTYDRYIRDCKRIVIFPVVDRLEPTGGNCMTVVGFSAFLIEECILEKNVVSIKGGFIRQIVNAGISDDVEDFGLVGIRKID